MQDNLGNRIDFFVCTLVIKETARPLMQIYILQSNNIFMTARARLAHTYAMHSRHFYFVAPAQTSVEKQVTVESYRYLLLNQIGF